MKFKIFRGNEKNHLGEMQFCEEKLLHVARIKHFPDLYIKAITNPQENEDYRIYSIDSLDHPVGFGEIIYRDQKPFIKLHLGLTENYYVSLTQKEGETYE